MKNLIRLLTLILILLSFQIATAGKPVDAKELKVLLAKDKLTSEEINKAYDQLEDLIEVKLNVTRKELLELCLLYAKHDNSDASYDLAYAIKKSNPEDFEKAVNELSKKDKEKIEEFIKLAEQEEKSGNG